VKRAALVFAVAAVLLLADGLYQDVTHYQPGDHNPIFGNPRITVSDGTTVLIAAGLLIAVSIGMWVLAGRGRQRHQRGR
jgi:hypothetical protein